MTDQNKSLLSQSLNEALENVWCANLQVVNADGTLIISSALGAEHICVIESLSEGDGGKGRMVRIKFSDNISNGTSKDLHGKRERMLLITLLLQAMNEKGLATEVKPATDELIIEQTHMKSPEEQKDALLKAVSVLFSLSDIDRGTDFDQTTSCQPFSLEELGNRVKLGLLSPENQALLKFFLANRKIIE